MLVFYGAYLIRCWRQGCTTERLEVVHVQSGERVLLPSLPAALQWIEHHLDRAVNQHNPPTREVGQE